MPPIREINAAMGTTIIVEITTPPTYNIRGLMSIFFGFAKSLKSPVAKLYNPPISIKQINIIGPTNAARARVPHSVFIINQPPQKMIEMVTDQEIINNAVVCSRN